MTAHPKEQINADVLELCSEDDYGSWELWWHISAEVPAEQIPALQHRFLDVVSDLVSSGNLIAKVHSTDGNITATEFDREKLAREVDSASNPDPDSYFWFGTE
jgi:hypothetical protein